MDDVWTSTWLHRESRRVSERGVVCWRDHDQASRDRLRGSRSDAGRDRAHEGPCPPGHGRRRPGGRILTHLRAGVLREHRRAHRVVPRDAAQYGGMYISHIRSEGNALLEGVDELVRIAREAGVAAEIYHLKAAGAANWPKLDEVIAKVNSARAAGLRITANMYTYTAGATGLDAAMPPWVQEGGLEQWRKRLQDPAIRRRVKQEMTTPTDKWENLFLGAGSPEQVLLLGFKNDVAEEIHRQDARRGGANEGEVARRHGDGPRCRGR